MQWAPTKIRASTLHRYHQAVFAQPASKYISKVCLHWQLQTRLSPLWTTSIHTLYCLYQPLKIELSGERNQDNQANEYTCQCLHADQSDSRFPKLCSSQRKCLVPGVTTEPGWKTRDPRKCKTNPKPAFHCVGRNQFRNTGNFCPDQPTFWYCSASHRNSWTLPIVLTTMPSLFHRVETCLYVLSWSHRSMSLLVQHLTAIPHATLVITKCHCV